MSSVDSAVVVPAAAVSGPESAPSSHGMAVSASDSVFLVGNGPFRCLPGEVSAQAGRLSEDGLITLTNYRLCVSLAAQGDRALVSLPLGLIECAELRELFYLHVLCKDARSVCITFDNNATAEMWSKVLQERLGAPAHLKEVFAFVHARAQGARGRESPPMSPAVPEDWFSSEMARLRFDQQVAWRVTEANQDFQLCPTYPERLLVPRNVSDEELAKVAKFRLARRVPSIVWRHVGTGAVLARSSQPEVGWLGWRSPEDEQLIRSIAEACAYDRGTSSQESSLIESSSLINGGGEDDHSGSSVEEMSSIKDLSSEAQRIGLASKVLIVDARSYAAALGNRTRGGGVECEEYYSNSEVIFMNLPNIHSIRKSFQALRTLCSSNVDQSSWFQALDTTKWLSQISGLFRATVRCARALEMEGRPVLVHCSDGWDRTPQLTSLTQLLLDPYYRSFEGFQVLVEKEWFHYGHKMADRCGNPYGTSDPNERSPIFLQWLDCVYQLQLQYPCHFEFNLSFLEKLARHTYSQLFGNFLCNSLMERKKHGVMDHTRSVWTLFKENPRKFRNLLYSKRDEILWPKTEVRDLLLWKDVYVSELRNVSDLSAKSSVISSDSSDSFNPVGSTSRDESEERKREETISKTVLKLSSNQPGASEEGRKTNGSISEPITIDTDCQSTASQDTLSSTETAASSTNGDAMGVDFSSKSLDSSSVVKTNSKNGFESSTDTLVPDDERHLRGTSIPNGVAKPESMGDTPSLIVECDENSKAASTMPVKCEGNRKIGGRDLDQLMARTHIESQIGQFLSRSTENLIDSDGLTTHKDMVQQRLNEIFFHHHKEVQDLRRDLLMTRQALTLQKNVLKELGGGGELLLLDTPVNGFERMSSTDDPNGEPRTGSTTSEVSSWEAVDEYEAKPVLWVPDHASEYCMRCQKRFWAGLRKHHCRHCGLLFCHNCSDNQAPVPEEHLYRPVRVCDDCIAIIETETAVTDQDCDMSHGVPRPTAPLDIPESEVEKAREAEHELRPHNGMIV